MCVTEFVVESCVYYGCVPWEMDRLRRCIKTGFPSRRRAGYSWAAGYSRVPYETFISRRLCKYHGPKLPCSRATNSANTLNCARWAGVPRGLVDDAAVPATPSRRCRTDDDFRTGTRPKTASAPTASPGLLVSYIASRASIPYKISRRPTTRRTC